MKVDITEKGVFVATKNGDEELAVGKVLSLGRGTIEVPGYLVNKCRVIGKVSKDAELVGAVDEPKPKDEPKEYGR